MQTIIALPTPIKQAVAAILAEHGADAWMKRAQALHLRYTQQAQDKQQSHIADYGDAVAYLGLRASATYAQIYGALDAVGEIMPSWQPKSVLDLGSGPGSGLWALSTLFPTLTSATCIDQSAHFLTLGKRIAEEAQLPVAITWQRGDILQTVEKDDMQADFVLIANVLNELNEIQRNQLLAAAFKRCRGLLIIVEPGTPVGSSIVQVVAQRFSSTGMLIAPYLGNGFVQEAWLHFPQRFTRPDFARRLRQAMRDSPLMASDWEEAKYSYVAIGKIAPEVTPWARVIGPIQLLKGYLEVPVLTQERRLLVKVLKRHKQHYALAKKLRWGETVMERDDVMG